MKFIFPQNYNLKNKFLGIFDYGTIFINLIWDVFVFFILNIFISSWSIKISVLLIFSLPLLIFSFTGFNGERIIYVLNYLFRFIFKQKVLFYIKDSNLSSQNLKHFTFFNKLIPFLQKFF